MAIRLGYKGAAGLDGVAKIMEQSALSTKTSDSTRKRGRPLAMGPEYSCSFGQVIVMESLNHRKLDDTPGRRRAYRPMIRGIASQ